MQYGTHFLDFCEMDDLHGNVPPGIKSRADLCSDNPTILTYRIELLEACKKEGFEWDIERQKFNINTLVLLKLMGRLPAMQQWLLAAQMGLREEIFQLNELLWRWLTSRSSSDQRDDPKKVKKLLSMISDKLIMLNNAIFERLQDPYLSKMLKKMLQRCLQTNGNFATLSNQFQAD